MTENINVENLINTFDNLESQMEAIHFETRDIDELNPCK